VNDLKFAYDSAERLNRAKSYCDQRGGVMRKRQEMIRDRTMESQGFSRFASSSIKESGRAIDFLYPSGDRYQVPVDYLVQWYGESHDSEVILTVGDARAIRSRKISDGHMVRVFMSDGSKIDVAWDVVLMACEPRYEHYGGLTQESKALVSRWQARPHLPTKA
jgi:hypothetical protein